MLLKTKRNPKRSSRARPVAIAVVVGFGIYILAHTLEETGSEETDAVG